MRILHITTDAPGNMSGGKIGVRQTLYSLSGCGYEIDYAGPEIDEDDLKRLYSKSFELKPEKNIIVRTVDSIRGYTNKRYRAWKNLIRSAEFDMNSYDAVLLDFTKLDYVAEDIPTEKLIVRVHNVEADYFKNDFRHEKSIKSFVLMKTAEKRERAVIERASRLLILTAEDKNRLKELYKIEDNRCRILPVCVKSQYSPSELISKYSEHKFTIIITGSLWFGPNYEGIKWFIKNVYSNIHISNKLIIAGYKPNPELKDLISKKKCEGMDIELIDSPEKMDPYFLKADLAVTPIFDGAGMKVKTAEALSYALPVVGTTHALTGYDIEQGINSWRADTPEDFIGAINEYAEKSDTEKSIIRKAAYSLYEKKYSQNVSTKIMQEEIERCVRKNRDRAND